MNQYTIVLFTEYCFVSFFKLEETFSFKDYFYTILITFIYLFIFCWVYSVCTKVCYEGLRTAYRSLFSPSMCGTCGSSSGHQSLGQEPLPPSPLTDPMKVLLFKENEYTLYLLLNDLDFPLTQSYSNCSSFHFNRLKSTTQSTLLLDTAQKLHQA